jgi:hypothetical protein
MNLSYLMLGKTERMISGSILQAVFGILENGLSCLSLDRQIMWLSDLRITLYVDFGIISSLALFPPAKKSGYLL